MTSQEETSTTHCKGKFAILYDNVHFDIDLQGQNLFLIPFQYFSRILQYLIFNPQKDSSLYLVSIES